MRRIAKWIGWTLSLLVGVPAVLLLLVLAVANTAPGERWIAGWVPELTGHTVSVKGLSGRFPDRLRAREVALTDPRGAWLTVNAVALDWSPLQLLHGTFDASRLDANAADFIRQPEAGKSGSGGTLPVRVVLHEMRVDRLQISPAVAGQAYAVALHGSGELDSYTEGSAKLAVRRLNGGGQYSVDGSIGPARLRAEIKANEPPDGLIASLAGIPDIGAVSVDATLDGPRGDVATRVAVSAGPLRASANGTLDLEHDSGNLQVSATAPAMTPRPDVSWQSIALDVRVQGAFDKANATGQVHIAGLHAFGGGMSQLAANIAGNAGQVHVHAAIDGLTLPGQDPALVCRRAGGGGRHGAARRAGPAGDFHAASPVDRCEGHRAHRRTVDRGREADAAATGAGGEAGRHQPAGANGPRSACGPARHRHRYRAERHAGHHRRPGAGAGPAGRRGAHRPRREPDRPQRHACSICTSPDGGWTSPRMAG